MNGLAKPVAAVFHLPHWVLPRLSATARQRKQATMDLIHASPYLLRDIGATESNLRPRGK